MRAAALLLCCACSLTHGPEMPGPTAMDPSIPSGPASAPPGLGDGGGAGVPGAAGTAGAGGDGGVVAAVAPPAPAAPLGEDEGAIALGSLCLTCHSRELIDGSRISPAAWKAEVEKMKKWGAAVPDESVEPLAGWLAGHVAPGSEPPPAARQKPAAALAAFTAEPGKLAAGDPEAGRAAYAQACASCHGAAAEGTGGGPALLDHPMLRQPKAFGAVVREGRGRMPGFSLPAPQLAAMLTWLRAQH